MFSILLSSITYFKTSSASNTIYCVPGFKRNGDASSCIPFEQADILSNVILNGICLKVDYSTADGKGNCMQKCPATYNFAAFATDHPNFYVYGDSFCQRCQGGVPDDTGLTCIQAEKIDDCDYYRPSYEDCYQCMSGRYLQLVSGKFTCAAPGDGVDTVTMNHCLLYSDAAQTICTKCDASYVVTANKCSLGSFQGCADTDGISCTSCRAGFIPYTNSAGILVCRSNNCQSGFYYEPNTSTCVSCGEGHTTCTSLGHNTGCMAGYYNSAASPLTGDALLDESGIPAYTCTACGEEANHIKSCRKALVNAPLNISEVYYNSAELATADTVSDYVITECVNAKDTATGEYAVDETGFYLKHDGKTSSGKSIQTCEVLTTVIPNCDVVKTLYADGTPMCEKCKVSTTDAISYRNGSCYQIANCAPGLVYYNDTAVEFMCMCHRKNAFYDATSTLTDAYLKQFQLGQCRNYFAAGAVADDTIDGCTEADTPTTDTKPQCYPNYLGKCLPGHAFYDTSVEGSPKMICRPTCVTAADAPGTAQLSCTSVVTDTEAGDYDAAKLLPDASTICPKGYVYRASDNQCYIAQKNCVKHTDFESAATFAKCAKCDSGYGVLKLTGDESATKTKDGSCSICVSNTITELGGNADGSVLDICTYCTLSAADDAAVATSLTEVCEIYKDGYYYKPAAESIYYGLAKCPEDCKTCSATYWLKKKTVLPEEGCGEDVKNGTITREKMELCFDTYDFAIDGITSPVTPLYYFPDVSAGLCLECADSYAKKAEYGKVKNNVDFEACIKVDAPATDCSAASANCKTCSIKDSNAFCTVCDYDSFMYEGVCVKIEGCGSGYFVESKFELKEGENTGVPQACIDAPTEETCTSVAQEVKRVSCSCPTGEHLGVKHNQIKVSTADDTSCPAANTDYNDASVTDEMKTNCYATVAACVACDEGCSKCTDVSTSWAITNVVRTHTSTDCSSCLDGYASLVGVCKAVPANCYYAAKDDNTAYECSQCYSGYGFVGETKNCQACADNMLACTITAVEGSSNTYNVLSCNPGFTASSDKHMCVLNCPEGFYANDLVCSRCKGVDMKCGFTTDDAHAYMATSCPDGYFQPLTGDSGPCVKMPAGCKSQLIADSSPVGQQCANCNDGYYYDEATKSCPACREGCTTCSATTTCDLTASTPCLDGYFYSTTHPESGAAAPNCYKKCGSNNQKTDSDGNDIEVYYYHPSNAPTQCINCGTHLHGCRACQSSGMCSPGGCSEGYKYANGACFKMQTEIDMTGELSEQIVIQQEAVVLMSSFIFMAVIIFGFAAFKLSRKQQKQQVEEATA